MSDLQKITDQQMDAVGVCSAPDVLSGSTSENKAVFDKMVRKLIAPAYNAAVDAIDAINETETGIQAAEEARVSAEEGRVSAEAERETAEEARVSAEEARVQAEQERAAAEEKREDTETGYVAQAEDAAQLSENWAQSSESWAVGGTGTRPGEDTNNAKYWSDEARKAAGGGVASFNGRTGVVLPEEGDYTREMLGIRTIHFGPQTSGNAFAITAEQMDQLLSDFPPLVFVTVEGLEIMLMRYDKTSDTAYYSNSLYDQDRKRFVRLVAKGTSATVHSAEESQIPMPSGGGDNGKYLRANAGGGFDLVSPDFFTKAETLKAATAELFGKDGTAVPDDIFFQIRLELLGKSLFTVKVLTQNGNPLPDIEISNVSSESGDPVKTDSSGIATGFVSPGSVNLGVLDYADIQNFQKGYVFEKGKKYSDEWTVTTRNFVKYTSSGRTRLSSNVTKADVSVGGAGGGGYTYEVGGSSGSKYGCGGGGGGYCKTQNSVSFTPDKYEDVVGAGGENGGDGGASSFLGVSANGGKGGSRLAGGEGNGAGGTGGKYTTSSGTTNPTAGGAGSGTVFSSYTSTVSYGGGGGGSGSYNESGSGPSTMAGAAGGSPAGGKGGSVTSGSVGSASNGTANKGGGGGGSAIITNSTKVTHVGTPGKGGDGVVAVRMTISVE